MFYRIQDILRSYFHFRSQPWYQDADFEEAWENLERFLRQPEENRFEEPRAEPLRGFGRKEFYRTQGYGFHGYQAGRSYRGERVRGERSIDPEETIRQDYENLQVPYGSDLDTVKKKYKSLLRKHHPDQFAQDPQLYQRATEITKKLNESFQRIKEYHEGKNSSRP